MRPNAESSRPLPLKDQMLQWLDTEEASQVYEAVSNLIILQHIRGGLASLKYVFNLLPEITTLSQREQVAWLKEQLPIEDVRHAAFVPAENRLILSTPTEGWKHGSIANSLLNKTDKFPPDVKMASGTTAKIKSTGHKIFVSDHTTAGLAGLAMKIHGAKELYERVSKRPGYVAALIESIEGLEKKGYTILVPEFATTGDIEEVGKFTLLTNK